MIDRAASVGEVWLPVPGSEGLYSASNLGRVRSEPVPGKHTGRQRGRIISPYLHRKGYMQFSMCLEGGRRRTIKVHSVVAAAFVGPMQDGLQVNHKNGDKLDNRVVNLEYVTATENVRHACAMGLCENRPRGERNSRAKLTANDVRKIREMPASLTVIGRRFGITKQNVSMIRKRSTWRHVA